MLRVMSGMDPHLISGTQFGLVELGMVSLLIRSTLCNGLCGVIKDWFGSIGVCLDI
jgi:hypothetical protein